MNFKKAVILLLTVVFCLSLAACQKKETQPTDNTSDSLDTKKELVFASTKDIRDINPHLYLGEMATQNMIFESLVINTPNGIEPALAQSWDISEDGKEYTFYLRQDVSFSDGEKFDAQAVKSNFDALLDNRERHTWLELVALIHSTEVVDEYTFKLSLTSPYYPTLTELGLTRPLRFISPNCFIDGGTKDGVSGYIGTGPWILTEHKENQYAVFTANENYWGEKPKITTIRWRVMPDHQTILLALEKGEIDLLFGSDGDMVDMNAFQVLQDAGKYITLMSSPVSSRAVLLNSNKGITMDLKVREALQYAVDKDGIANGILNGTESIADSLMARTVPYSDIDLEIRNYDPQKAALLLEEAGWMLEDDGYRYKENKKFEIMISYNSNNAQEKTISEYLQSDFKKIGVALNILGEEKQAFLDRQKTGEFDLQYSLSWGPPYDPATYLSSFRIPAHGDYQAQAGLSRKDWLDETIGKILLEQDEAKRQDMYTQVLTYLHEECVYLPLTYSRTKAVYSSRLKGVEFNVSQYEIPFEKMYFE